MLTVLKYFVNLGVKEGYSIEEQHMVRHCNVLTTVTTLIYLWYVLYGIYISSLFTSVFAAVMSVLIGVVFWLNSIYMHGPSKVLAAVVSNFSVWFAYHVFPINEAILSTFVPIVASYIYLYDPQKERIYMLSAFGIAAMTIVACFVVPRHSLQFVYLSPEVVAMSNATHVPISLGLMMVLLVAVIFTKNSINDSLKSETIRAQEALDQLMKAQDRVVDSEKMAMLGFLSAGLNHEINNPLNYMFGSLDQLEKACDDDDKRASFKVIREGMNRINEIVSSLRNFTHQSDYMDHDCDINAILDTCSTMVRSKHQHDMALLKDYEKGSTVVKGNSGRLHQLFLNLLINATQAISKGGIISVKTRLVQDAIQVNIVDNGKGIDSKDLPYVFDPFYTTKFPGEGTGLGLAIAKTIVTEHQGEMDIAANEAAGITVQITLPVEGQT
ncbi:MAG: HAMP domain-containing sensor histidine kinase [Cytophagales bacterium]|nr:HAMP domain-containing sensor histidine kinase [Cytophagales bacterium]